MERSRPPRWPILLIDPSARCNRWQILKGAGPKINHHEFANVADAVRG